MSAAPGESQTWPAPLLPRREWGRRGTAVLSFACVAAVVGMFFGDYATTGTSTVGALGAIPVLVAAWFLSRRWTLAITMLALLLRLLALVLSDLTPVTFGSQSIVLVVVALAGSVASMSVRRAALARAALGDMDELRRAETAVAAALAEAEAASQAKSEYLSRVSHELRTPLTVILGFAGLLELEDPRPDQQASIAMVLKAADHLLRMIDELLAISKIEAGREELALEPVGVDEVVTECVDLVALSAGQRRVVVHREPSDERVVADSQRLKQVVLNLLTNAVKYNREGGHVDVSTRLVEGGRVRITVKDSGPGIPLDLLPRLFQPFDRLGAERTAIEGTGLGLALSKHLVELMEGTIGVDSEPGAGSSFWLELATAPAALDAPHPVTASAAVVPTRTVLYVEDNLASLELVERTLRHRPALRVIPLMQGSLAIDIATQHHPDLVLLDLHLPDIDGDEVLRRLKAAESTRDIPVIMLSADVSDRNPPRMRALGAAAFLTKPIKVRDLLDAIDEALPAS
ncbi:MAG: ATP-binding protein [Candidatus Dormibacteraeota bacterium]|nr:ATP-binding protein [Candidatus Dormibacteraeota bacterium]